jgi:hypothetical protein
MALWKIRPIPFAAPFSAPDRCGFCPPFGIAGGALALGPSRRAIEARNAEPEAKFRRSDGTRAGMRQPRREARLAVNGGVRGVARGQGRRGADSGQVGSDPASVPLP